MIHEIKLLTFLLCKCSCIVRRKMVNRRQEWFLTVLITGMEPSIMTILLLLCLFILFILAFHLHDFYISCRAPNPDTVLIMQTPHGVISTKSLVQTKRKVGSRLISSNRIKVEDTPPADNTEHDPFSAARCRIFVRTNHTKKVTWSILLFFLVNVCKIINLFILYFWKIGLCCGHSGQLLANFVCLNCRSAAHLVCWVEEMGFVPVS